MAEEPDRVARGRRAFASQFRLSEEDAAEHLRGLVGPRMAEEAILAAGGAWVDDVLSFRDRSLVVVSALASLGGLDERLRIHVRWALDNGVTAEELEETVTVLAVYAGYARASVAMQVVRDVLAAESASAPEPEE